MAAPEDFVNVSRRPPDVEDYIDMLRRYRSWILGPAFAGLVASVVLAFVWPEQPSEPNRLAIAGAGLAAGLTLGIVLAVAQETKNTSLKNLKDVRACTNLPVLSSIPLLENALLLRRKRRLFWLAWSAAIIVGTALMGGSMFYYFSRRV